MSQLGSCSTVLTRFWGTEKRRQGRAKIMLSLLLVEKT